MNRERFEDLKAQAEQAIRERDAKTAELQEAIRNSQTIIALQTQLRDEAGAEGNVKAYASAQTLIEMHTDRIHKAEEEQRQRATQPIISGSLYDEIRSFLITESEAAAAETRQEVRSHLDAIAEIIDRSKAYYQELNVFAGECERVNRASITGKFQNIPLGSFPLHFAADLMNIKYNLDRLS